MIIWSPMNQMKKMGGLASVLSMMPGMGGPQMKQIEKPWMIKRWAH